MSESRFVEAPYQERLHAAIGDVVNDDEAATQKSDDPLGALVVTKWVCIVEVMDTSGEKWLTGYRGPTSNSIPVWDAKGLLLYAAEDMEFATSDDEDDDDAV